MVDCEVGVVEGVDEVGVFVFFGMIVCVYLVCLEIVVG